MKNVSILLKIFCNECVYSIIKFLIMKNHFSKNYKEMKWSKNSKKCKIQLSFIKQLKKYIQIENYNKMEINIDNKNKWKEALKLEFEESKMEINIFVSIEYNNI